MIVISVVVILCFFGIHYPIDHVFGSQKNIQTLLHIALDLLSLKQYISILFGLPSLQSIPLFLVSCRRRHRRQRRREFTLLPDLGSIFHEDNWNGYQ